MVGLPTFAGIRNRRARQAARRGIVLRDAGITKQTQSRYYLAVSAICKVIHDTASMEDFDEQIADWIESEFRKGSPLNIVADGLSGIHYFLPSTRRRLPVSWKLFANWRKIEVPSRAAPLPEGLCWAMMARALRQQDFDLASLLGLGFHCFLRTGELLSVRPCDILLRGEKGIVTLPSSKGGTRHNVKESVTIFEPHLVVLLVELLDIKRRANLMRVPMWTKNGTAFRKAFHKLTVFFKVEHMNFRGYSLRRGGATAFFQDCGLMEKTLLRGRWNSVQVARLYLCDALAQLPDLVAGLQQAPVETCRAATLEHVERGAILPYRSMSPRQMPCFALPYGREKFEPCAKGDCISQVQGYADMHIKDLHARRIKRCKCGKANHSFQIIVSKSAVLVSKSAVIVSKSRDDLLELSTFAIMIKNYFR